MLAMAKVPKLSGSTEIGHIFSDLWPKASRSMVKSSYGPGHTVYTDHFKAVCATNQTFLHIDHAQSMLVSLQFRYHSLIKLLSTQPSCLNVRFTSVVKLQ